MSLDSNFEFLDQNGFSQNITFEFFEDDSKIFYKILKNN